MKRSKLVCLSLSLLVSIGLLAGCGGEKKEAGKASETVLKIGHVEPEDRSTHKALLFWWWMRSAATFPCKRLARQIRPSFEGRF